MIHFITGGQRSGKSRHAEQLALSLADNPVYLATSKIWDEEHKQRINRHKKDRSEAFETVEEELYLSNHDFKGKVVLLDCVTLWLTNWFDVAEYDVDKALALAKQEWDKAILSACDWIVVSNEIGMGVIPDNVASRRFVDLQGWTNQYIASTADHVTMMVSGIPLKVK